jgi:hypothetical protein
MMQVTFAELEGVAIELLPNRETLFGILSPNIGTQVAVAPATAFNILSIGGVAVATPNVVQALVQS